MSNKQRLQVNNTNLSDIFLEIGDLPLKALVEAAAREGQYVWKKLTAEGGTFLDYVVSDSEVDYPDGGTQDEYWYEKVDEGVAIALLGCTKFCVDKVIFSGDEQVSVDSTTTINHSLGELPKLALFYSPAPTGSSLSYINYAATCGSISGIACSTIVGGSKAGTVFTADARKVTLGGDSSKNIRYIKGGIENTLITMA